MYAKLVATNGTSKDGDRVLYISGEQTLTVIEVFMAYPMTHGLWDYPLYLYSIFFLGKHFFNDVRALIEIKDKNKMVQHVYYVTLLTLFSSYRNHPGN